MPTIAPRFDENDEVEGVLADVEVNGRDLVERRLSNHPEKLS